MSNIDRIIREEECRQLTGLSRTRRYELEQLGRFPKRLKLSEHATGWRLSSLSSSTLGRARIVVATKAIIPFRSSTPRCTASQPRVFCCFRPYM